MAVPIPEELMEDILVRLPTKSLMRFKSVRQSWNALFKTNSFIKRHSQKGSIERFMIFDEHPFKYLESNLVAQRITLLSSNEPTFLELPGVQHPFGHHASNFDVMPCGHCNGVFVLAYNADDIDHIDHFCVLWNPATREIRHVPNLSNSDYHVDEGYFGIGANPNTLNDIKLVEVCCIVRDGSMPVFFAELYSTSTNSWTVLHDVGEANYFGPVVEDGVSVNGAFYWLSFDRTTSILRYDFCTNQLSELSLPQTLPGFGNIIETSDSIAYAVEYSLNEDDRLEIWILKQDNSWTKVCNIQRLDCFFQIYGIWKDSSEFIAGSEGLELASYDFNAQPLQQFEIIPEHCNFRLSTYVESIVPLSL